jgi:hypothetical protein
VNILEVSSKFNIKIDLHPYPWSERYSFVPLPSGERLEVRGHGILIRKETFLDLTFLPREEVVCNNIFWD